MRRVTVPWAHRLQLQLGVLWVREKDFDGLEAPCELEVVSSKQRPIATVKVGSVERFTDHAPVGAGRKREDVFLRLELDRGSA